MAPPGTRRRLDPVLGLGVAPGLVFLMVFFALPMTVVGAYSFLEPSASGQVDASLTLANYRQVFDPLYAAVLLRSAALALATTALSLLVSFPAALAIRGMERRRQALLMALLIIPSWMNLLVKNYAWMVILRRQGVLNTALLSLGVTQAPLSLLFNPWAVLIGLVHTYLPFMLLPLYVALERLDWTQVEAARDLSAGPWQTFERVILPQTQGGVLVGCTLVFIPALGAFITPDLLGGPESLMVGTLVESQVLQVRNWPFASALSASLMALVVAALVATRRVVARQAGGELL